MTVRLAPYPDLTGREPCRQPDAVPDVWFTAEDEAFARAECRNCPARTQCLAWALDHPEYTGYGIWAALDTYELNTLRRAYTPTTNEGERETHA